MTNEIMLDFGFDSHRATRMQREFAIRQLAKASGYRLEKNGDETYRLVHGRLNVAVYGFDGVPLEAIASFLERPEIRAHTPSAQFR
jgi:hypothetical protein